MIDINMFFFCLNYLNAYTIETLIYIINLLGLISVYLTKSFIPFIPQLHKLRIAYISLETIFLILTPILLTPIVYYRIKKLANLTKKNDFCRYLSMCCTFSSLFGFLTSLATSITVFITMDFPTNKDEEIKTKKKQNHNWIKFKTIVHFCFLYLVGFFLILLSMSELLRLNLRINAAYKSFLRVVHNEVKIGSEFIRFDKKSKKNNSEKKNGKDSVKNNNNENNTTVKKINTEGAINEINEVIINPLDKKFV